MRLRGGSDPVLLKKHRFAASRDPGHNIFNDVGADLAGDWRCCAPSTSVEQLKRERSAWADPCID